MSITQVEKHEQLVSELLPDFFSSHHILTYIYTKLDKFTNFLGTIAILLRCLVHLWLLHEQMSELEAYQLESSSTPVF